MVRLSKRVVTAFNDGKYTVINKFGTVTPIIVKRGLVYVENGFAGGATGKTIEQLIENGSKVEERQED